MPFTTRLNLVDAFEKYTTLLIKPNLPRTFGKKRFKYGCIHKINPPKYDGYKHAWGVIKGKNGKPLLILKKRIGSIDTRDGEAHLVGFVKDSNFIKKNKEKIYKITDIKKYFDEPLVVKFIPINKNELFVNDPLEENVLKELYINILISDVFFNQKIRNPKNNEENKFALISSSFPIYLDYFICPKASKDMFHNKNIVSKYKNKELTKELLEDSKNFQKKLFDLKNPSNYRIQKIHEAHKEIVNELKNLHNPNYGTSVIILLQEKADMDLDKYLENSSYISIEEVKILSFYILHTLYCLHECLGIIHLDLHLENILLKLRDKRTHSVFKINTDNKLTYIVPDHEYYLLICDFGGSEFLDYISPKDLSDEARHQYRILISGKGSKEYHLSVYNNLTKNKKRYQEFFKSFDVYRVFRELYVTINMKTHESTIDFLREIINKSRRDFVHNLSSQNSKNMVGEGEGKPYNLLKTYFSEFYEKNAIMNNYIKKGEKETDIFMINKDLINRSKNKVEQLRKGISKKTHVKKNYNIYNKYVNEK